MRFTQAAVLAAVLLPPAAAFAPTTSSLSRQALTLRRATTAEPPAREAPGAGYVPEWENRQGKAPEEFLQSDMEKDDLSGMWECPLTRWDSQGYVYVGYDTKEQQHVSERPKHSFFTLISLSRSSLAESMSARRSERPPRHQSAPRNSEPQPLTIHREPNTFAKTRRAFDKTYSNMELFGSEDSNSCKTLRDSERCTKRLAWKHV